MEVGEWPSLTVCKGTQCVRKRYLGSSKTQTCAHSGKVTATGLSQPPKQRSKGIGNKVAAYCRNVHETPKEGMTSETH